MFKPVFNVFKTVFINLKKRINTTKKEKNEVTTSGRSSGYMSSGNVHADMKRTRNRKRNKVAYRSKRINNLIERGEL